MQKRFKTVIGAMLWVFSIAWLVFLAWLSSQNGTETAQTSMWLTKWLAGLFGLSADRLPQVDRLLRTMAHFGGFFVLGGLFAGTARLTWPALRRRGVIVLMVCSLIAVLDEVKKGYIVGRHLSWPEAGLNILGAACGVIAVLGLIRLAEQCRMSHGRAVSLPYAAVDTAGARTDREGKPL